MDGAAATSAAEGLTPDQMSLAELRLPLARALRSHVPFDGWTRAALSAAAADIGIPADRARLVFRGGAADMVDAHTELSDSELLLALDPAHLASLRIRERITSLLRTRFELAEGYRETLARGVAVLGMPQNVALATRILWRSVDRMWRAAGDTATGIDHYTKRATLAAVYSATLFAWLADESEGRTETWSFLDRRIADVMQFEKVKASLSPGGPGGFSVARFLGRLRYPVV
jgi:ubiquinone biosynthesis protein COQ9